MKFSRTELGMMKQIADGNRDVQEIARALHKSKFQIYRSGQKLVDKGFVELSRREYTPLKSTHTTMLFHLVSEFPSAIVPLSDSGISILQCLVEPKTLNEAMNESGLRRTQVFKKLKQARMISIVRHERNTYMLNEKLWSKAIDFFTELKKYEETTDPRIPGNATIIYKNEGEIIFSSKEEMDATRTAFSAYEQYKIKVLSPRMYYYLPQKKLSLRDVFLHSLSVAEKEAEVQDFILVALFYAKYKNKLGRIRNVMLENIKKILEGERIPGYPTVEEIKDRASIYDIKI